MELSKEIINVLEYLGEKIGVTIDWTNDNVLPYVKQLCEKFIKWEISTSFAWIVIAIIVAIGMLIFALIVHKHCNWDGFEWLLLLATIVITFGICAHQTFDIIECTTFPEKAIYEYIQDKLDDDDKR